MKEQWRAVVGYEGLYEVSDCGRVRSLPRRGIKKERMYGGQMLRQTKNLAGYMVVGLSKNNMSDLRLVQHVVLEAFRGPRPTGMWCCHRDDNRGNNLLENLRWGTPKSNCADRKRNGSENVGARNGMSKLKEWQVVFALSHWARLTTRRKLAEHFGVKYLAIWYVQKGIRWKGLYS